MDFNALMLERNTRNVGGRVHKNLLETLAILRVVAKAPLRLAS